MATDDRDEFEDDDYDPPPRRSPEELIRNARARLAAPGTLLVVAAVVMLLLWLGSVGLLASGYDTGVATAQFMADLQPPGPAKQQLEQQVQQLQGRDRTREYIQGAAVAAVNLPVTLVILVGGLRMKRVRSYGLSLAAAICGMIPVVNPCCCLGLPFGVWALVVLLNPDVKAAFAANRSAGRPPEVLDPGFDPDR